MTTIVIGIRQMIGSGDTQTEWHLVMVTARLAILPPVIVILLMQLVRARLGRIGEIGVARR